MSLKGHYSHIKQKTFLWRALLSMVVHLELFPQHVKTEKNSGKERIQKRKQLRESRKVEQKEKTERFNDLYAHKNYKKATLPQADTSENNTKQIPPSQNNHYGNLMVKLGLID